MKDFSTVPRHRLIIEGIFTRLGLGMRAKLITLFIVIKVVPLILLALVAWGQSSKMGKELQAHTDVLAKTLDAALIKTGDIAVHDAVAALDTRATEDIERTTTDIARRVADFLYTRDADIRFVASLKPDASVYRAFVENLRGNIVRQGKWELDPEGKRWVPSVIAPQGAKMISSIEENDRSFNYRQPDPFTYESRPLYYEITFIDLDGKEKIKVTTSPRMNPELKNVSRRADTYIKAEEYFRELEQLRPGDIYVSDVIGAYVGSRVIGIYTPAAAAKAGEEFRPEKSAYAGMENPLGERFKGIVRWGMPVMENGKKIGYVTLALDHDHIMEFTNHIIPTAQRYTELSDASEGNYAFIWDHKGRSITHARHFSIAGYDPETGDPHVPWLEDRIYNAWQTSGKPYAEFIKDEPTFVDQSVTKKPAPELTKKGFVGLDCRYLNFAPQCTGWFDLTREGGSGSFVILWSGLRKLTTAAAIPYYTGQYAKSKRGFGFVAVGAGVDDFHRPATNTKKVIDKLIQDTDQQLEVIAAQTQASIDGNLYETATRLSVSTCLMAILVIFIAIWMASAFTRSITKLIAGISRFRSGERQFRFNSPIKDEMGILADSLDDLADGIVDSVQAPLVITDTNRSIKYMNGQGLERLGKTLPDVLGKPYGEFSFHAEADDDPITALLEGRESSVYHTAQGGYFQDKAGYLQDKEGNTIGYLVTTADVTEIVASQLRIEEQRSLLNTIFSSSPDLIWYKRANGVYLAVNPRFAALAGMTPEEFRGTRASDIFSSEEAAAFMEHDRRAVEQGTPYYAEETLKFHDGHEEIVDSVRTPVKDVDGTICILGVARNVTRRVETEQRLREMQLELRNAVRAANKANESKSDFLARMSHEIRTPMNAIIGMANIVKRKLDRRSEDPDGLQSNVRQIEVSSQHLLGLLNDILDISKIEAGKIELSAEPFDLPRLIDAVGSIIRPRCMEKNIAFTIAADLDGRCTFISDALRLRQVLINLLGNAVKFTPECGTVEFSVTAKERSENKVFFEFTVKDDGIGISNAVKEKLFSPFEQGDRRISRQYGGTGLGLSISRNIVRLMGGDITVESVEGCGSTFSFGLWLPEAEVPGNVEVHADDRNILCGKRILLVDDVAINRMIVVDLLDAIDLTVDEADDGAVALDMVAKSPEGYYSAILMDVQMPNMDGYEASIAIRALGRKDVLTMPIIAMTANAFREDVEKAFASGMTGHMAKPLEFEKLVQTISEQILAAKAR
ncbi:Signal transduction histidine kinase [uncultured delta proteobacterium]|uniref:histidine kinase n=1 Tax=uncultured delta proteobacterium TaxID=34034 RepID=A0A212JGF4_9DELT|nr:Signal transduction histidine kinase [uncultured delta proteobacterium]